MKRVQAGCNWWRIISGVICDRRLPAGVKGEVYKVAVGPARAGDCGADEKTGCGGCRVEDVKIFVRSNKIRNEYIRLTVQVRPFGEKLR